MSKFPVVLFGYDSSTFTLKIRLVLKLKQIPYTFIPVPTMMPRPTLRQNFHLTYRKIPVLAIGRELYCDTSLITEALEHFFPPDEGYPTLFPSAADGRTYKPLIRGFASYWTDRPLFRIACGLMPASIWRSEFGQDRAQLIGHKLDADKLERKIPENLTKLDQQLSMLEPLFAGDGPWVFSTARPSLADVAIYCELLWGSEIAKGRWTEHITAGEARDEGLEGADVVFNEARYPSLMGWFGRMRRFFDGLGEIEDRTTPLSEVLERMKSSPMLGEKSLLLPTPRSIIPELDERVGLRKGASVSVTPDDTGKDDPTIGELLALSPEEVVIKPHSLGEPAAVPCRIHFPRLGFVVRPVDHSKL